jgi:tRNA (guanine-N7-)-methyltransferase
MIPELPFVVAPGREMTGPRDWARLFGRSAPLVVEVGFGKDPFLLERAAARPAEDHVGIERDPGRVAAFVREIRRRGLSNVRVLPVSAELALAVCFDDGAVAELHVYFPDPWPKLRHARHRLVQPWFAREAGRVLAPEGRLFIATDDAPYARQIRDVLAATLSECGDGDAAPSTKFERLWRSQGRTIHRMVFGRRSVLGHRTEFVRREAVPEDGL